MCTGESPPPALNRSGVSLVQGASDDVHPHHEVVAERVDVRHAALRQHDAVRVTDGLVHVDGDAAVVGLR